jgi:hypothetical protein
MYVLGILQIGSCEVFAWAGLELWSSWSCLLSMQGLQA